MRSEFWRDFWNKSAKKHMDIRFISGWGNRTFQEMLFVITDVAKKLELRSEDVLLDVGCGAGLFEIAFSPWLKEIYGVDYSEEQIKIAKRNTEKYDNVVTKRANILNLPFEDGFFNKVLVNSVIQYLNGMGEVEKAFEELNRVTLKQCRILVSLIPDADKKKEFIRGYSKLGLSKEEIKEKIESTERAIWFDKNELKRMAKNCGFQTIDDARPFDEFQKRYYFDLIIEK